MRLSCLIILINTTELIPMFKLPQQLFVSILSIMTVEQILSLVAAIRLVAYSIGPGSRGQLRRFETRWNNMVIYE